MTNACLKEFAMEIKNGSRIIVQETDEVTSGGKKWERNTGQLGKEEDSNYVSVNEFL